MSRRQVPDQSAVRRGFSLIELVMVVIILGLLAAIAMPRGVAAAENARLAAGYENYRRIALAFEGYHAVYGEWPADDYAGNVPPGMEEFLNETEFEKLTPFGGWYDWSTGYGFAVGLGIYQPTAGLEVFDQLDARFDDGVRTSGHLQVKLGEWFYVLRH